MKKLFLLLLFCGAGSFLYGQVPQPHSDSPQNPASTPPSRTVQLDWHQQLKKVQDELAVKPDSAFLHSQAATAYNALGDFPAFEREIHLAINLDKKRAAYQYFAYAVYKQRHLKTLQIQALDHALEIDPDNPLGHYERAGILEDDNKWADALAEYQVTQKMLERAQRNPDSRSYSKWTYLDPRGDPYDMTIEKAHISEDLARVQAKLSAGKTAP